MRRTAAKVPDRAVGTLDVAAEPIKVVGHAAGQIVGAAAEFHRRGMRAEERDRRDRPVGKDPNVLACASRLEVRRGLYRGVRRAAWHGTAAVPRPIRGIDLIRAVAVGRRETRRPIGQASKRPLTKTGGRRSARRGAPPHRPGDVWRTTCNKCVGAAGRPMPVSTGNWPRAAARSAGPSWRRNGPRRRTSRRRAPHHHVGTSGASSPRPGGWRQMAGRNAIKPGDSIQAAAQGIGHDELAAPRRLHQSQ